MSTTTSIPYWYEPNIIASIFFFVIIVLLLVVDIAVMLRCQRFIAFGILIGIGCVFEALGYADRLYQWFNGDDQYAFVQQYVVLLVAPVLVTSSIYSISGHLVKVLGNEHCPIWTGLFTRLFIPIDGVAVLLQATGSSTAFSGHSSEFGDGKEEGARIPRKKALYLAAAGVGLQAVVLVAALVLQGIVCVRARLSVRRYGYTTFHKDVGYVPLGNGVKAFGGLVIAASAVLLVRVLARMIQLIQGDVDDRERRFVGSDSCMVLVAMVMLIVCHPAISMRDEKAQQIRDCEKGPSSELRQMEEQVGQLAMRHSVGYDDDEDVELERNANGIRAWLAQTDSVVSLGGSEVLREPERSYIPRRCKSAECHSLPY